MGNPLANIMALTNANLGAGQGLPTDILKNDPPPPLTNVTEDDKKRKKLKNNDNNSDNNSDDQNGVSKSKKLKLEKKKLKKKKSKEKNNTGSPRPEGDSSQNPSRENSRKLERKKDRTSIRERSKSPESKTEFIQRYDREYWDEYYTYYEHRFLKYGEMPKRPFDIYIYEKHIDIYQRLRKNGGLKPAGTANSSSSRNKDDHHYHHRDRDSSRNRYSIDSRERILRERDLKDYQRATERVNKREEREYYRSRDSDRYLDRKYRDYKEIEQREDENRRKSIKDRIGVKGKTGKSNGNSRHSLDDQDLRHSLRPGSGLSYREQRERRNLNTRDFSISPPPTSSNNQLEIRTPSTRTRRASYSKRPSNSHSSDEESYEVNSRKSLKNKDSKNDKFEQDTPIKVTVDSRLSNNNTQSDGNTSSSDSDTSHLSLNDDHRDNSKNKIMIGPQLSHNKNEIIDGDDGDDDELSLGNQSSADEIDLVVSSKKSKKAKKEKKKTKKKKKEGKAKRKMSYDP